MNGALIYLDSSALVRFVLPGPETGALTALLAAWPERISSSLARVEVLRAARRAGGTPDTLRRARDVLDRVALVRLDDAVLEPASRLEPAGLRSPEAIHLSTALSVGDDLGGLVSYDSRLNEAARASGIPVFSPGAES